MPTYEYQCRSGAHRFEARQGITASPLTRCPHCGKKVDRLISAGAGFLFKGSGFYTTDYRSKPYQAAAKQERQSQELSPAGHPPPTGGFDAQHSLGSHPALPVGHPGGHDGRGPRPPVAVKDIDQAGSGKAPLAGSVPSGTGTGQKMEA